MEDRDHCPICGEGENGDEWITLRAKGKDRLLEAASERGETIGAVDKVHVVCRRRYTNKKDVELSLKRRNKENEISDIDASLQPKRITRSCGGYMPKIQCLFCCQDVQDDDPSVHAVKTTAFSKSMTDICLSRSDVWAVEVRSRLEYLGSELHAADCVYHHACSVNFRTGRQIPAERSPDYQVKSAGRPVDQDLTVAFQAVCDYLTYSNEVLTVSDLCDRMWEISAEHSIERRAYSPRYMKKKLLDHFGNDIRIVSEEGLHDLVIFEKTSDQIVRDYFDRMKNTTDAEIRKVEMIKAVVEIIRTEMKKIPNKMATYPSSAELSLETALDFVPSTLRTILCSLLVGEKKDRKVATIGQAIVQNSRPRSVIAPLNLALGVQLHYQFRSRYLIDHLNAMGLCCSYAEVTRFAQNAAAIGAQEPLGETHNAKMVLFAGDNVDANIVTLDGKNTFHGMGLMAAITPANSRQHQVPRKPCNQLDIESSKLEIKDYHSLQRLRCTISFSELLDTNKGADQNDRDIDMLWELSFSFKRLTPNWSGTMSIIHRDTDKSTGKSSFYFLPIIDMSSTDETCIYSTLCYVSTLAHKNGLHPVLTFDQPIYWKACEIVEGLDKNDDAKEVVLLLGTFHMTMNLLGAIGYLMSGSGITEFFESVYGEQTIPYILSGKAVQRSLRAHLLLDKCITYEIVQPLINESESFRGGLEVLESLYESLSHGRISLEEVMESTVLKDIGKMLRNRKDELSAKSRTHRLWTNYLELVALVRDFIRADRTGSWELHLASVRKALQIFAASGHSNYLKSSYLYLMKMNELKVSKPALYTLFQEGYYVSRRVNQDWHGMGSDLLIEQQLMRGLKTRGGLSRGSGWTDHQRTVWTMSAPVCSEYNLSMQNFTSKQYTTSDQHKEERPSRIERDETDFQKMLEIVQRHKPMSEDNGALRNVVTGIHAHSSVDVDNYKKIGNDILAKMLNANVFSYVYSRKHMAKNMSSSCALQVGEDRFIDPIILFQRLLVVAQSGDTSLKEVMDYELSPFPPALFEDKVMPLKADKAPLAHAIHEYRNEISDADLETVMTASSDAFVLDGGSLLYRLKWDSGSTFGEIADRYISLLEHRYADAVIVFDGYKKSSTKDITHERRNPCPKPTVTVSETTKFCGKRDDFLSNANNKDQFICLLIEKLIDSRFRAKQVEADADVMIVKTTMETAKHNKSVSLIGEDTDLLVLLLHHMDDDLQSQSCVLFKSDRNVKSAIPRLYNLNLIRSRLGIEVSEHLLFIHAFTGSDTTSRIFGISKKAAMNKLMDNPSLMEVARTFCQRGQSQETITKAGVRAMIVLFGGGVTTDLATLRYSILSKKITTATKFVHPKCLPPTENATKHHAWRTYLQVMEWMGEELDPLNWGWKKSDNRFVPIAMDSVPAPERLLNIVHCNCRTGCTTMRCGCRKYGLACSSACGPCQTNHCANGIVSEDEEAGLSEV